MREKLATLPLAQLRELAKGQGIKNVSGLRKSELIDRLCELAEKEEQEKQEREASQAEPAEAPAEVHSQAAPVAAPQTADPVRRRQAYSHPERPVRQSQNGQGTEIRQEVRQNGSLQENSVSAPASDPKVELQELDSGIEANGILEVMPDGFGFIRCENYLPGENDVYVAPSQIRRFNMKTGDIIRGSRRVRTATEKFAALLYVTSINSYT